MKINNLDCHPVRRYRRRRATRVLRYNSWDQSAEPGDLMVAGDGKLFLLTESSGWQKAANGELTPREIKPPVPGWLAGIVKGDTTEVWWFKVAL